MTDTQLERAREAIEELRDETRESLAEELGGDPEEYRADSYRELEPDGGDE
jgi:hypothetical protein